MGRPMTTSGPRITTATTTGTPPDTAAPPPPLLRLPSRRPTASSPSTADGERVLDLMCIRSELAAVRSLSLASDIIFFFFFFVCVRYCGFFQRYFSDNLQHKLQDIKPKLDRRQQEHDNWCQIAS